MLSIYSKIRIIILFSGIYKCCSYIIKKFDTPILEENKFNLYEQLKDKVTKVLNDLFNKGITDQYELNW